MNSRFAKKMAGCRFFFIVFISFISTGVSFAQEIPQLRFHKDSVLIGDPTSVSFVYYHNSDRKILFPDSTYDFSPFEFERVEVFPTVTTDSISKDSVVYWLSTFEIDKVQYLKLPAFVYTKKDSIPVFSNTDTIHLTEVITTPSDTLKIKENTNLQPVESEFNYPIFSIVVGTIVVIIVVLLLLFSKKIRNHFLLKKLERNHIAFLSKFDTLLSTYKQDDTKKNLEKLVGIWKLNLEQIMKQPITKLSTKELSACIDDETILTILKDVDGKLFGGIALNSSTELMKLKNYTELQYLIKTEELKHAKSK